MEFKREFFPMVKKTIMPRPAYMTEVDVLGQGGVAWASQAAVFGPNWYHDREQNLIEIYDAGPALNFKNVLPKKDKYAKEGLYLKLGLAYRTTENANVNIRTFSGNHVSLPNAVDGAIYWDPNNYWWVTDDLTININSIFSGEKLWIQRVDWEWVSKDVVYEDEIGQRDLYVAREEDEISQLYAPPEISSDKAKEYLIDRIRKDDHFAKRCMVMLRSDKLYNEDIVDLYREVRTE